MNKWRLECCVCSFFVTNPYHMGVCVDSPGHLQSIFDILSCNIESDLKVGNVLIALLLIGLVAMTRRNVPNVSKAFVLGKDPPLM